MAAFVPSVQSYGAVSASGMRTSLLSMPTAAQFGFQPSEHSYGWASGFPLSALTVTSQKASNRPATSQHESNLSLLSDFLAKLPFSFRVNSGYRSPEVNALVGGATSSQHMNGLATDITPSGLNNEQLATWFYNYRDKFPELDQVIWYTDTHHVHIGICPPGGAGCKRRAEFLKAQKEGSNYQPWAPTPTELAKQAALFAAHRPLGVAAGVVGIWIGTSIVGLLGFASFLAVKKFKKRRLQHHG